VCLHCERKIIIVEDKAEEHVPVVPVVVSLGIPSTYHPPSHHLQLPPDPINTNITKVAHFSSL
jgi:hypothetical protein